MPYQTLVSVDVTRSTEYELTSNKVKASVMADQTYGRHPSFLIES